MPHTNQQCEFLESTRFSWKKGENENYANIFQNWVWNVPTKLMSCLRSRPLPSPAREVLLVPSTLFRSHSLVYGSTISLSLSLCLSIDFNHYLCRSKQKISNQPTIAAAASSFNENFISETVLQNLTIFAITLYLNCRKKLFAERSQHWPFYAVISGMLCELFREITVDLLQYFLFVFSKRKQNKSTE